MLQHAKIESRDILGDCIADQLTYGCVVDVVVCCNHAKIESRDSLGDCIADQLTYGCVVDVVVCCNHAKIERGHIHLIFYTDTLEINTGNVSRGMRKTTMWLCVMRRRV